MNSEQKRLKKAILDYIMERVRDGVPIDDEYVQNVTERILKRLSERVNEI